MKLTRLRIAGFKSFVEPTEMLIEPGLTGVVGPNGCGKSNLVEALRWVMGESSHKSLRASGMDDVIFAGSSGRPARNSAEVMLVVDNGDRKAPAVFNEAEVLEVSRRIVREEGSTYRINGREVRARDVQLLFADAATGARSAALVRQGQISEIIAAKPQARRRILEDAAGIAGLHTRRHEAELRLKAAEENLLRLNDVLREIDAQADSLRRQGKQAARYRALSGEIRRLEALSLLLAYTQARDQAAQAEHTLEADVRLVAERTQAQGHAAKEQAVAAAALPALRQAEAEAAAALQRLTLARNELDAEERRTRERAVELERRIVEIGKDKARETALSGDAAATIARLAAEAAELDAGKEGFDEAEFEAKSRVADADGALAEAEGALSDTQTELAELNAKRAALERARRDEAGRLARFEGERAAIERDLAALDADDTVLSAAAALREETEGAQAALRAGEERVSAARAALAQAREAESTLRTRFGDSDRAAQRLETEARTLAKLFAPPPGQRFAAALDAIRVARGYETALGAAFGEDLDAALDPAAPVHWLLCGEVAGDPPLPEGAVALATLVEAPDALKRRLRQIGVVERAAGASLRAALAPGQRLVSREGDLWRWDGYTAAADAPSAAARRLAEKNRLGDLERDAAEARARADALKAEFEAAQGSARAAAAEETAAQEAVRTARRTLDGLRERLNQAERRAAEAASRRAAAADLMQRVLANRDEAQARLAEAEAATAGLASPQRLESRLLTLRTAVAEQRTAAAEARAALQNLQREAAERSRRREAIEGETKAWRERAARAGQALADMEARLAKALEEARQLAEAPDTFLVQRRALTGEIEAAGTARKAAADRLAQAETTLAAADRAARDALAGLAEAREARAGSEARLESAKAKLADIVHAIAETLEATPAGLHELAGHKPGEALPAAASVDERMAALKAERERLGAVNLRAEDELTDVEGKRDGLVRERDDLDEAIRRLRQAIGQLNREGRERLLAAFDVVNAHFQRLFTNLFGGGTAELTLVDAEDPLEAGLEILARPPGKKPQVMTLLSGGEQALTATALIFAVFLTNPSPICVLDEVDAPLDDANVERYCELLQDMVRQSETRFVVITHNPITMARMDRLFGVTMAERGISQLVSVDLQVAERMLEAG